VNVFRPRSIGEGVGRAWYPGMECGSTYAMAAESGAEMTMMEKPLSFRRASRTAMDRSARGSCCSRAQVRNGAGEDYNGHPRAELKDTKRFGKYGQGVPGTCLRNHIMITR